MVIFWRLLLAHLLADFTLQLDIVNRLKRKSAWGMLLHCLTHLVTSVALTWQYLGDIWFTAGGVAVNGWQALALMFVVHYAVDELRVYSMKSWYKDNTVSFLVDQIVHVYVPSLWAGRGVALHAEALALPVALLGLAGDAVAIGFVLAVSAVGLARAALHDRVTQAIGIREGMVARGVQLLLGLLAPVTAPAVAALFWTSARTRVIRWRHIEYEVLGPEQVRVLRRHAPGAAA